MRKKPNRTKAELITVIRYGKKGEPKTWERICTCEGKEVYRDKRSFGRNIDFLPDDPVRNFELFIIDNYVPDDLYQRSRCGKFLRNIGKAGIFGKLIKFVSKFFKVRPKN
ncbi:hypothetical protein Barb6_00401 [Bacteroidales bacterium Barb6]|nr:hypothetical protein Barb6_00401 [Bacteroidales bacterium Barb6]